jgi:hypothetical protein
VNENYFWRDDDPKQDRALFTPSSGWAKIEEFRRRILSQIELLEYSEDISGLLIRYVSALDQTDHDVALLQMWTILEKITGTIGANYDETIKRASWIFTNRLEAKELLECIRIQRNRYVHASRSADEAEEAAYLIKSLIEPHLLKLIENDFNISSLNEYSELVSLPTEKSALQKMKRMIDLAGRVHHPESSSETKNV